MAHGSAIAVAQPFSAGCEGRASLRLSIASGRTIVLAYCIGSLFSGAALLMMSLHTGHGEVRWGATRHGLRMLDHTSFARLVPCTRSVKNTGGADQSVICDARSDDLPSSRIRFIVCPKWAATSCLSTRALQGSPAWTQNESRSVSDSYRSKHQDDSRNRRMQDAFKNLCPLSRELAAVSAG